MKSKNILAKGLNGSFLLLIVGVFAVAACIPEIQVSEAAVQTMGTVKCFNN